MVHCYDSKAGGESVVCNYIYECSVVSRITIAMLDLRYVPIYLSSVYMRLVCVVDEYVY